MKNKTKNFPCNCSFHFYSLVIRNINIQHPQFPMFFQTENFAKRFYKPPTVILSAKQDFNSTKKDQSIVAWVKVYVVILPYFTFTFQVFFSNTSCLNFRYRMSAEQHSKFV